MKKFTLGLAGVLSLVVSVSTVVACPNEGCAKKKAGMVAAGKGGGASTGGCAKPCSGGSSVTASASDAAKAVLASMPAVKYRVGEQTMCCPNAASAAAKTENKPVEYVVGEEAFKSQAEADARLVALYEKEIESMVAVQYSVGGEMTQCPHAAKDMADKAKAPIAYVVGGVEFADQAKAEAAVKLVADAAAGVKMSYKVDGKPFCCDKMAGEAAKTGGKPIVFVVGSDEIAEESAAKLVFAQAKIRAIVEAANAAKNS
jgi:hypothetical protein